MSTAMDIYKLRSEIVRRITSSEDYSELFTYLKENHKGLIASRNDKNNSFIICIKQKDLGEDNVPNIFRHILPNIYRLEMERNRVIVSILKSRNNTIYAGYVLEALGLDKDDGVFVPSLSGNFVRLSEKASMLFKLKYNIGSAQRLP